MAQAATSMGSVLNEILRQLITYMYVLLDILPALAHKSPSLWGRLDSESVIIMGQNENDDHNQRSMSTADAYVVVTLNPLLEIAGNILFQHVKEKGRTQPPPRFFLCLFIHLKRTCPPVAPRQEPLVFPELQAESKHRAEEPPQYPKGCFRRAPTYIVEHAKKSLRVMRLAVTDVSYFLTTRKCYLLTKKKEI